MNLPISWFKEFLSFDMSTEDFAEALTMSGTKVETIEYKNSELKKIVVGKILEINSHPDADKLVVCQVDVGDEKIQIVTGAKNVNAGDLVPIVLDGGVVAGNHKIKKGKLRGVESNGMMCSIEELGYTTTDYPEAAENGIYIFQEDHPLGADVCDILMLKDDIIEFEITSNRPDCYSFMGILKEAAATINQELNMPPLTLKEEIDEDINELIKVKIQDPDLCYRYTTKIVKDIKIEASPLWLRHRLSCAGIRPINNYVDLTNYAMILFGQPMHAFDLNEVAGSQIIVRRANSDDKTFVTLDGIERDLDEDMLLIADKEKPIAIAGIMGGENSKITDNAKYVLFESASFNGTNVRLSSKRLGLRTDSSSKFEKGLDPNLTMNALDFCAYMIEKHNWGKVVKSTVDVYPNKIEPNIIKVDYDRINKLLGINLKCIEINDILKRVNIKVLEDGKLEIPTLRRDITGDADIAEEVARIYGYNKIPVTLANSNSNVGKLNYEQKLDVLTKNTMTSFGLFEALNYSFESPKVFDKLLLDTNDNLRNAIEINNPLGEDFSIMRTTTVNGMLNSLSTNFNRKNDITGLFEIGKVYLADELPINKLPREIKTLTIGTIGLGDFYDIKGYIEEYFDITGINNIEYTPDDSLNFMHPYRTAKITYMDKEIGYVGEVHPVVLKNYNIGTKAYIGTINLQVVEEIANLSREYTELFKYPPTNFDIALIVNEDVLAGNIEKEIITSGGKNLEAAVLFDVYQGENIEKGKKSVAYKLTFRDKERTLNYDEVKKYVDKILNSIEKNLGGKLRQ